MPRQTIHRRRILKGMVFTLATGLFILALGAAGLLYGWTHFARSLPALQGWHLEGPPSEFNTESVTPGYSFGDYQQQEQQVFEELDAFLKEDWADGNRDRFSRYQTGSICNPATLLDRNWNRTYVLKSPEPVGGVLLLHGLSDSPYALRTLGNRLHQQGYTVIGLRLPGHGTCPAALAEVAWEDWVAAVRVAAEGLQSIIPADSPLILCGFSNGGALSVHYALESVEEADLPQPSAIVLLSPMIGITSLAKLTRFHQLIAAFSGEERANWSSVEAEIDPFKYNSWPMNASVQAWQMTQQVEQRLAALERAGRMSELPPILAFQSAIDSTVVVPRLITELFDRLGANGSELVLFDVNRAGWLENLVSLDFETKVIPALQETNAAFALTLVTNESEDSLRVVARTRTGQQLSTLPLDLAWPQGVFSLSHVALPIPPDDPVYGTGEATEKTGLPLGSLSLRGEQGVLRISDGQVLRLRHNPFYTFTEEHALEWLTRILNTKESQP
jgi:alpha-beta hydrolase superfamily lysophospholipase